VIAYVFAGPDGTKHGAPHVVSPAAVFRSAAIQDSTAATVPTRITPESGDAEDEAHCECGEGTGEEPRGVLLRHLDHLDRRCSSVSLSLPGASVPLRGGCDIGAAP
jgi:hypothetical protein